LLYTGRQKEKALAAEREKGGGGGRLSETDVAAFTALLTGLTVPSRHLIREAMGMALDKSDASAHIVELLTASLTSDSSSTTATATAAATGSTTAAGDTTAAAANGTTSSTGSNSTIGSEQSGDAPQQLPPPAVMVARLYLVSDILHNSSAPVRNSSSYRTLLQNALPRIFEALGAALRGVSGRITARQLQDRVLSLLKLWEQRSIYPPLYVTGLEATFMRKRSELEPAAADSAVLEADLDRVALDRKARQAGLHVEDSMSALQLLHRLNLLSTYVKAKAAGGRGSETQPEEPAGSGTAASAGAAASSVNSVAYSDSDSDVDGVPLPATAVTAAVQRSSSNGSSSSRHSLKRPASGTTASASAAADSDSDSDIDGVPLPPAAEFSRPEKRSRNDSYSDSRRSSSSRSRSPQRGTSRQQLPPPPPVTTAIVLSTSSSNGAAANSSSESDSTQQQAAKKSRWD
jgi:CID domain